METTFENISKFELIDTLQNLICKRWLERLVETKELNVEIVPFSLFYKKVTAAAAAASVTENGPINYEKTNSFRNTKFGI